MSNSKASQPGSFQHITEAVNILRAHTLAQPEAADRLGVSRVAVRSWVRRGQILNVVIGTDPRIPLEEIDRMSRVIAGEERHYRIALEAVRMPLPR